MEGQNYLLKSKTGLWQLYVDILIMMMVLAL